MVILCRCGKEWMSVGMSGILFLSVGRSGKRGEGVGECELG